MQEPNDIRTSNFTNGLTERAVMSFKRCQAIRELTWSFTYDAIQPSCAWIWIWVLLLLFSLHTFIWLKVTSVRCDRYIRGGNVCCSSDNTSRYISEQAKLLCVCKTTQSEGKMPNTLTASGLGQALGLLLLFDVLLPANMSYNNALNEHFGTSTSRCGRVFCFCLVFFVFFLF